MKKFFALLKVSVKAMLLTSSGVGAGRRRRAASGVGAVLLIAFLGLYLSGMYSFMLVDVLAPVGMESLVLVFMGLVALLGGLLFTVFAVRGVLFGGKDNDLMLSLPVPASMLVASRMAAIYVENLVFSFFVLLPAGAACFFLGSQDYGLGLWLRLLLAALALPLLDTVLSVVLGAAVAFLSAKVSRGKALGQNLVMAVFFVAVFWFSFQLNGMIGELAAQAGEIKAGMGWAAPLLWMADGVLGNWGLLLAFLACCVVPFVLVALVLGRVYRRAVTAFQSKAARSDYKLSAQSAAGQRKALLRKEAKRFFGTPIYFWNAGIGLILLLAMAVAAVVKRDALLDLLAQMGGVFPVLPLVAGIMGFCLSMSVICAPSISLEGRCLWILREAPVGESVLLWGKAGFQMLLTVPCTLAAVACLTWALALPVWQGVVLLAGLLAFDVGHACFGMLMGLAFPKLDAANDTLVIKQSMAVMLAMFLPMLGLALSGGVWWLADMAAGEAAGPVAAAGTLVLMAAACAGILSKRGPRMLRAL